MNSTPAATAASRTSPLVLIALETMPCGCVAGVYRARPTLVELELVEAKGPNCLFNRHRAGNVVSLDVPAYSAGPGGEPAV
jgi:hypothetical protein